MIGYGIIDRQEHFRLSLSVDSRYIGVRLSLIGVIHGTMLKALRC